MNITIIVIGSLVILAIIITIIVIYRKKSEVPKTTKELPSVDGGTVDGGTVDGGTIDGGTVDGGTVDGGTVDGGTIDGDSDNESSELISLPENIPIESDPSISKDEIKRLIIPLFRNFLLTMYKNKDFSRKILSIVRWKKAVPGKFLISIRGEFLSTNGVYYGVGRIPQTNYIVITDNAGKLNITKGGDFTLEEGSMVKTNFGFRSLDYDHVCGKILDGRFYDVEKIESLSTLLKVPFDFQSPNYHVKNIPITKLLGISLLKLESKLGGDRLYLPLRFYIPSGNVFELCVLPIKLDGFRPIYAPESYKFTYNFKPMVFDPSGKNSKFMIRLSEMGPNLSGKNALMRGKILENDIENSMPYDVKVIQRIFALRIPNLLPSERPVEAIKLATTSLKRVYSQAEITPIGYGWELNHILHLRFKAAGRGEGTRRFVMVYSAGGRLLILHTGGKGSGTLAENKTNIEMVDGEIQLSKAFLPSEGLKVVKKGGGIPYTSFIAKYVGLDPKINRILRKRNHGPDVVRPRIKEEFPIEYILAIIGKRMEIAWRNQSLFTPISYYWQNWDTIHVNYQRFIIDKKLGIIENRVFNLKLLPNNSVIVTSVGESGTGFLATTVDSINVSGPTIDRFKDMRNRL